MIKVICIFLRIGRFYILMSSFLGGLDYLLVTISVRFRHTCSLLPDILHTSAGLFDLAFHNFVGKLSFLNNSQTSVNANVFRQLIIELQRKTNCEFGFSFCQ